MNQLKIYYHKKVKQELIKIKDIPKLLKENPDKIHVVFNPAIISYRFVDFSFRTVRDFKKQYVKLRSVGFDIEDIIIIQFTTFLHYDEVVSNILHDEAFPIPTPKLVN